LCHNIIVKNNIILVLDNIRSVHNVGAMFRTAEAVGVDEILLVGITPAPLDRFGRERSDLAKAAVGAQNMISWKQFNETTEAVTYLQELGADIVSLEITNTSVDYKLVPEPDGLVPFALVVGNENTGVSQQWLDISDIIAHIPMAGKKESLNVSTSCGIALFRMLHR